MKFPFEWMCKCGKPHTIKRETVSLTCSLCYDTYKAPKGQFRDFDIELGVGAPALLNRFEGKHPRDLAYKVESDGVEGGLTHEQAMNKALVRGDMDAYGKHREAVNKFRRYRGLLPLESVKKKR